MYIDKDNNFLYNIKSRVNKINNKGEQIENWLADVEDPIELHAILDVAKEMDLSTSKMKIISAKLPEANVFDD